MVNGDMKASGRLKSIEKKLDAIADKLDSKVDITDHRNLEFRVREIELHGSETAQKAVSDVDDIRKESIDKLKEVADDVTDLRTKLARYAGGIAATVVVVNMVISLVAYHVI